jgi:hypothetical protein
MVRLGLAWGFGVMGVAALLGGCSAGGGDESSPGPQGSGAATTGGSASGGAPAAGGISATGGGGGGSTLPPAGACSPAPNPCTPTVLDSGLPGPGTLQVQNGYLYWRNAQDYADGLGRDPSSVLRLQLPNGSPEVLAVTDGSLATIAVDATDVYLTDTSDGLARVPITGGTPEWLASYPAVQVVLDDVYAYFSAAMTSGAVFRIPKAGGAAERRAPYVYWVETNPAPAKLSRVPKGGGIVEVVDAELAMHAERLLAVDGDLYVSFSDDQAINGQRGAILRYPAAGGEPVTLATHADPFGAIGIDADSLYVATCPGIAGAATVFRVSRDGGTPVAVAQGGTCYAGVTVDATTVYFAEWGGTNYAITGDGAVLSAPKCGCP